MKKLLLLFLSTTLLFSCSKDDSVEPTPEVNGFSFNSGEVIKTTFATRINYNNYYEIIISDKDFSTDVSGKANLVGVLISGDEMKEGTYTFLDDEDANYDAAKNFFDSYGGVDHTINNDKKVAVSSSYYKDIKNGTITISKNGNKYMFTYNISFEGGTFKGTYNGEIKTVEDK